MTSRNRGEIRFGIGCAELDQMVGCQHRPGSRASASSLRVSSSQGNQGLRREVFTRAFRSTRRPSRLPLRAFQRRTAVVLMKRRLFPSARPPAAVPVEPPLCIAPGVAGPASRSGTAGYGPWPYARPDDRPAAARAAAGFSISAWDGGATRCPTHATPGALRHGRFRAGGQRVRRFAITSKGEATPFREPADDPQAAGNDDAAFDTRDARWSRRSQPQRTIPNCAAASTRGTVADVDRETDFTTSRTELLRRVLRPAPASAADPGYGTVFPHESVR